ncbi:hypothetical protein [Arthrobacter sp. D1-29]
MTHVTVDGAVAEEKPVRDLMVGRPGRDQGEHLKLPAGTPRAGVLEKIQALAGDSAAPRSHEPFAGFTRW